MKQSLGCCPDCGVEEGEIHLDGCDWEFCEKCGKQVIAWGRCKGAKRGIYLMNAGYMCQRCGEILCDMKMVSDELWEKICGGNYGKDEILCPDCMDFIIRKRRLSEDE